MPIANFRISSTRSVFRKNGLNDLMKRLEIFLSHRKLRKEIMNLKRELADALRSWSLSYDIFVLL